MWIRGIERFNDLLSVADLVPTELGSKPKNYNFNFEYTQRPMHWSHSLHSVVLLECVGTFSIWSLMGEHYSIWGVLLKSPFPVCLLLLGHCEHSLSIMCFHHDACKLKYSLTPLSWLLSQVFCHSGGMPNNTRSPFDGQASVNCVCVNSLTK